MRILSDPIEQLNTIGEVIIFRLTLKNCKTEQRVGCGLKTTHDLT
jgi:hypothetical protein